MWKFMKILINTRGFFIKKELCKNDNPPSLTFEILSELPNPLQNVTRMHFSVQKILQNAQRWIREAVIVHYFSLFSIFVEHFNPKWRTSKSLFSKQDGDTPKRGSPIVLFCQLLGRDASGLFSSQNTDTYIKIKRWNWRFWKYVKVHENFDQYTRILH